MQILVKCVYSQIQSMHIYLYQCSNTYRCEQIPPALSVCISDHLQSCKVCKNLNASSSILIRKKYLLCNLGQHRPPKALGGLQRRLSRRETLAAAASGSSSRQGESCLQWWWWWRRRRQWRRRRWRRQRARGAGGKGWPGNCGRPNVAGVDLGCWCRPQMLVCLRRFGLDLSWDKKESFVRK